MKNLWKIKGNEWVGTLLDRTVVPSSLVTVIRHRLFRQKTRRNFIQTEPFTTALPHSLNCANGKVGASGNLRQDRAFIASFIVR